jgi:hypothetical protein
VNSRDFQTDFCMPAIRGLSRKDAQRVAKALDVAIAFGALEHASDNESLQDLRAVEARYWSLVMELKKL